MCVLWCQIDPGMGGLKRNLHLFLSPTGFKDRSMGSISWPPGTSQGDAETFN